MELPAVGVTATVEADKGPTAFAPGSSRGRRPGPQS